METLQDFHSSGEPSHSAERNRPHSPVSSKGFDPLSANAQRVLEKRYLLKDETGKVVEDPEGLPGARTALPDRGGSRGRGY